MIAVLFSSSGVVGQVSAETETVSFQQDCNCYKGSNKLSKEEALKKLKDSGTSVNENLPQQEIARAEKALKNLKRLKKH
ncbi:hypothetical protein ACFO8Q_23205 [Effusibacillus consociatus]|uniref:Uncharacterized protein n=2 Tax=Effusibacillus consociatus TaxID=1117041 RepID=A0ABV9Q8H1_9BACL